MVQNIKKQYPNENWVIFDSESILNTIQLFNNAKLVIGMHGAGLSNIVFANQDIPVLEFAIKLSSFKRWVIGHDES